MKSKVCIIFGMIVIITLSSIILCSAEMINPAKSEDNKLNSNISGFVEITSVNLNNIELHSDSKNKLKGVSGSIPLEIQFKAMKNVNERVIVKVSIESRKGYIEKYVILRTPLQEGVSGYIARFNLDLPENISNKFILNVRIYTGNEEVIRSYLLHNSKSIKI